MAATITELNERLKNLFSDGADALTANETSVATQALVLASAIIVAEFVVRGGTAADAAGWGRLDEFTLDIATFITIMDLGKDRDDEDKAANWAKHFDRRAELKEMDLIADDGTVITDPSSSTSRPVNVFNLRTINSNLGI